MIDLLASREIQRSGYRASGIPDGRVRCGPPHKAGPWPRSRLVGSENGGRRSGREGRRPPGGGAGRRAVRPAGQRRTPVGVRSACPDRSRPFLLRPNSCGRPPDGRGGPAPADRSRARTARSGGWARKAGRRLGPAGTRGPSWTGHAVRTPSEGKQAPGSEEPGARHRDRVQRRPPMATSCTPPGPPGSWRRPWPGWRSSPRPSGCRRRCPCRPRRSGRQPSPPRSGPCHRGRPP